MSISTTRQSNGPAVVSRGRPMGNNSRYWAGEAEAELLAAKRKCKQLSQELIHGNQFIMADLVFDINEHMTRALECLQRAKEGAVVEVTE